MVNAKNAEHENYRETRRKSNSIHGSDRRTVDRALCSTGRTGAERTESEQHHRYQTNNQHNSDCKRVATKKRIGSVVLIRSSTTQRRTDDVNSITPSGTDSIRSWWCNAVDVVRSTLRRTRPDKYTGSTSEILSSARWPPNREISVVYHTLDK